MREKKSKHSITALLLTVLFITYYCNTTMLQHTHYVDNIPVTHSHPFSSGPHSHSTASLFSISVLNHVVLTTIAGVLILQAFKILITEYKPQVKIYKVKKNTLSSQLRAPPAL